MSEPGTRPGGLTALAVINFVFGGFGVLGAFATAVAPLAFEKMDEERAAESRAGREPGRRS